MQSDGQIIMADLDGQDDTEAKDRLAAELADVVAVEAERLAEVERLYQLEREKNPEITQMKDDLAAASTDAFNERMAAINAQIAIATANKRQPRNGPIGTGNPIDPRKAKRRAAKRARKANR